MAAEVALEQRPSIANPYANQVPPVGTTADSHANGDGIPHLTVVPGLGEGVDDTPQSLTLLAASFESRDAAEANPGVRGEVLEGVRAQVGEWLVTDHPDVFEQGEHGFTSRPGTAKDYATTAASAETTLLWRLTTHLEQSFSDVVTPEEIQATKDFLLASFAIRDDVANGVDLSQGDHLKRAFQVPVRLDRGDEAGYSQEIAPYAPALRYVPGKMVSAFLRGMSTFIADEYEGGGYLVVTPISLMDMLSDVDATELLPLAQARVNDSVRIGKALGCIDHGYGAIIPGVMGYGRANTVEGVTTTTGHAGTAALVSMIVDKIIASMPESRRQNVRIGVLGLGRIGLPAAGVVADLYPDAKVTVFDPKTSRVRKLLDRSAGRFTAGENEADVLNGSDIILSFAGVTINLRDKASPNYVAIETLEGKTIVDDSEPRSFLRDQVVELGGMVLDVLARSQEGASLLLRRRSGMGYGHTMVEGWGTFFGCEAEVAHLNNLRKRLLADGMPADEVQTIIGDRAITGFIEPEVVRQWKEEMTAAGVEPAEFQHSGVAYKQAA